MKHSIQYIILAILLFLNGCATFRAIPEVEDMEIDRHLIKNISLAYKIDSLSDWANSANTAAKHVEYILSNLTFRKIVNKPPQTDGYFCRISVKYVGPVGAGVELLTGISLGLIPTYTSETDYLNLKYVLFFDNENINEQEYKITLSSFNWLPVIPVAWGPYNNEDRMRNILTNITYNFLNKSFR